MAASKNKRPAEDEAEEEPVLGAENPADARKKRVKYTEQDAQLAQIYSDLADEVQATRIKAAGELLKNISIKSDNQQTRLELAESRLIKGLSSGRKAARLGFSIALSELLRLKFNASAKDGVHLEPTLRQIVNLTRPEGNVSGQEKRDHLLGRRFAFQAVLQSDVGLSKGLTELQWQVLIQDILRLASEKQWLRRECGTMLYDYLSSPSGRKLSNTRIQILIDQLVEAKQLKTPEGVGLWVFISENFADVTLPKAIWNHNDPLSSKERPLLCKIMLENVIDEEPVTKKTGSRQTTPSFAWTVIIKQMLTRKDGKDFGKFWSEVVADGLFTAKTSTERRSLGLQVFSLALALTPSEKLLDLVHGNVLRCILDQRADKSRYLFDSAKTPLSQLVARAKQDDTAAPVLLQALLENGALNFDQASKTRTVENVLSQAADDSLPAISASLCERIQKPSPEEAAKVDTHRRVHADLLLSLVRSRGESSRIAVKGPESKEWLSMTLRTLTTLAFDPQDITPPFSESTTTILRSRLMSCLNGLLEAPLEHAIKGPLLVIKTLGKTDVAQSLENKSAKSAIKKANKSLDKTLKQTDASSQAFSLLISLSVLQVYSGEPDAVAALDDLVVCYENQDDDEDSSTTLIELLLSFISKQSALFRKLAEQVFSAFASQMTADSLQSLTDILGQKESLSGQQELFDQGGEDGESGEDESGDEKDGDEMDVEDASDVELVNGKEGSASGSDSDGENNSDSDSESDADADAANEDEDEEAIFDRKLAAALGTPAAEDDDADEHGSDMDDDQMLALEPHLTTIFRERRKQTSKKSEKKSAKQNILHFKARVLDLLLIYVKSQHGSVLALDLVLPLVALTRTSSDKATAEKAFAVLKAYVEACGKHKSHPRPGDVEAVFGVLEAVHEEMTRGGSKLHASACSRGSLFLSKVLVGVERGHYARIAGMYAALQVGWWADRESKIQGSVFTEWTSWSIGTRKGGV